MTKKMFWVVTMALALLGTELHAQEMGEAIKIGVLTDHSGGFAYLVGKHSVDAAQMAVDDFGGKVLGRSIVVVTGDHQNKPDIAAAISRKWFDTEGVTAVTDVAGSAVALATQEVARSREKVLLISGAATTELTGKACSATSSQWSYDTYSFAKGTASQVRSRGRNSWFFLTSDYAFGHSLQNEASRFVQASGRQGSPAACDFLSGGQTLPRSFSNAELQSEGYRLACRVQTSWKKRLSSRPMNLASWKRAEHLASLVIYINDIEGLGWMLRKGLPSRRPSIGT